jgi:phosphoglycerate dehydrogenase-like enzyme
VKILVPSGLELTIERGTDTIRIDYDPLLPIPGEHQDAEFLVAWGNTQNQLEDTARRLTSLRWVQSLAAGSEGVLAAGFSDSVVITSGRSLHDGPVAEHALALALAGVRSLHTLGRRQAMHVWSSDLGGAQVESSDGPLITLHDARVLVWGFGSIAATLAPWLSDLGAIVTGVARSAGIRGRFPVISEQHIDEVLPTTDLLILILPGDAANRHVLSTSRLALLPSRAWVVNVGRGIAIDEAALVEALEDGRLAGAALDVFESEPLAESSPLWDLPNVIISPHSAGGRPRGAEELVNRNLAALLAHAPLTNVVSARGRVDALKGTHG